MPDQADTTTEAHGEPTPDQANLFTDPQFHGAQMTGDDESMADTQRMMTPEDAARATLNGVACELGHDEVRVLTRIAERLRGGQVAYGPLALSTDPRNFRIKEAREELKDALVYLTCAWLKAETHLEVTK